MNALTRTGNQRGLSRSWPQDFFDVENLFGNWPFEKSAPAVNVSESDKSFMVDVVAPGFKKEDFKVSKDEDMLTISAESKHESKEEDREYSRREYSCNSFTRSFQLPDNAKGDGIEANYSDGVLKLTIPKTEPKTTPAKTIPIK